MSQNKWVELVDSQQPRNDMPEFRQGDTVRLMMRVRDGARERLQAFEGVVLARRGGGLHESVIVRRISHGVGVERTICLNSPALAGVEVKRLGRVRQGRIYWLRDRSGRRARIPQRIVANTTK